jgi:hypothetical protein
MKPPIHVVLVLVAAVGCGGGTSTAARTSSPTGSATRIAGSEMSGNLLQSLRNRVPSMTVSERSGECPRIAFRGQRALDHRPPTVYVDGAMMLDTCILNQISSSEVDYVEVHPNGLTGRAGVQSNPSGVILVFRVRE